MEQNFQTIASLMKQRGMTDEQIRKSICEAVHSSCKVEGSTISLEEVYEAFDALQKRKENGDWKNYKTKGSDA